MVCYLVKYRDDFTFSPYPDICKWILRKTTKVSVRIAERTADVRNTGVDVYHYISLFCSCQMNRVTCPNDKTCNQPTNQPTNE
jgi:hypothetical protein